MKRILPLALMLALAAPAAQAACFADYKAKRDNPLRLQYGVIELSADACRNKRRAASEIEARIAPDGWQLLNVMSLFDADGLNSRKDRAGQYFLRY